MVKVWVANTDPDWFDFLAAQPNVDEVNFWQPSGSTGFGAIRPGELFLFRLKAPRDAIGGYGVFSHASNAPISLSWEAFGYKNGARTLDEMRARVGRYRGVQNDSAFDYQIGCRVVVQPVFLPEHRWLAQPPSWANGIVVGKTYDTAEPEGLRLWEQIQGLGGAPAISGMSEVQAEYIASDSTRYGEPKLIRPRLGQGAFRLTVTDTYGRACAVTGGKVLPALDAAHIRPYAAGGVHEVRNGLLLRRDIHSVFDAGYVTIDDSRFVVSDRVKTDFNNGNEYRRLHGQLLNLPANPNNRPSVDSLRWHNENLFRA
ncbi:MAG: HNH endonuclease [Bauldia sp.]|nr:HNH endonuclease [Bauldia sp.]